MAGLFETLIKPDREEDPERAELVNAANILQVGEFQLLQLAYKDWFAEEIPDEQADGFFQKYIVHQSTPAWALRYARRIIDWDARGLLDMNSADYHRYDNEYYTEMPQGVKRFTIAALCLLVAIGGALLVGHYSATNSRSVLPPYFDDDELPKASGPTELRGS